MDVVFVADSLKKPDPGYAGHRAVHIVISVEGDFFVVLDCIRKSVKDRMQAVITVVEAFKRGEPSDLSDNGRDIA